MRFGVSSNLALHEPTTHFSPAEANVVAGLCFKSLLFWQSGLLELTVHQMNPSSFPVTNILTSPGNLLLLQVLQTSKPAPLLLGFHRVSAG